MENNIGKKLDGRYEIQEILGVGGMAVVYKAYDSIDDRVVAVKILKEEYLSNDDFRRRFKNESKAVALLSHPNIVKVYDVNFGEKIQYIVMEYINGITLKEYIEQQRPMDWKEAVHFTVQILRALQHAHDKGIVHRDIKPQNIMLLEDGTIKVTDFGIARFAHSETHTLADKAIGSVHYISPEQARGGYTDEKSDVYSAGVILFEMLTGQLPFDADTAVSVAIKQLQETPSTPRSLNPEIPEGLEEITIKAMQKDTTQRYQSASEMLSDIDQFKRNPSIHFQYKYFVDESPTKYVDAINRIRGVDEPVKEDKKGKKLPVIPVLSGIAGALVLFALIAVLAALAINGILPGFGSNKSDIEVPNLIGMKLADAQEEYKDSFKIVQENTGYSDIYDEGEIMSQTPESNITAKQNSTIKVTVSKGSQKALVPDVYGDDEATARSVLRNAGFTNVVTSDMYSDTVEKGKVVQTDPARGTNAPIGGQVTVYISLGSQSVVVPDVSSTHKLTQAQATKALTDIGLKVNVTHDFSSTVTEGYVISQSPSANSSVALNTTVTIVVSNGVGVTIPSNIVNGTLGEARTKLNARGLNSEVKASPGTTVTNLDDTDNVVVSIDPDEDTKVKVGSTVTLYVINPESGPSEP
jgi:serine/threonine protein kinase